MVEDPCDVNGPVSPKTENVMFSVGLVVVTSCWDTLTTSRTNKVRENEEVVH